MATTLCLGMNGGMTDEWAVQERLHGFGEPRAGAHYSVSPSETPVHPLSTFWSLSIESEVGEAEVGGWLQFPVWPWCSLEGWLSLYCHASSTGSTGHYYPFFLETPLGF